MDDFGWRFWGGIIALVIGVVVGGLLFYWAFGWAWYTWGFFAAFGLLALVLIGFGYAYDKREQRKRSGLAA
jgi:hypothetical protein